MKLKNQTIIFLWSFIIVITANASPLPTTLLAQRNCAGDLSFTRDIDEIKDVTCTWDKDQNDTVMSLTTHFEDPLIRFVEVHCKFYPALPNNPGPYTRSRITQVSADKACTFTGLDINSELIQFNMHYTGTNPDKTSTKNNANIMFYLNNAENDSFWNNLFHGKASYNDHDQIVCSFKVVR